MTVIRWARYSALAWMSEFKVPASTVIPATASGDQLADRAFYISGTRNTPFWPEPVTATRTPSAVRATNTPTRA